MIASKHRRRWLVAADGITAKFYQVHTQPLKLELLPEATLHGVNKMTRDLESDRPGVSFESVGGARHAIERHSNAQRRQKELFALRVAAFINNAAQEECFDEIIVVAPPRTLGDLRRDLNPAAQKCVAHEIGGDWTKLDAREVARHLKPHLAPAQG